MAANIELEIQNQLIAHTPFEVMEHLLSYAKEAEVLSPDEIQAIFTFFIKIGAYQSVLQLCLENFAIEKFATPWHLFIEALTLSALPVDQKTISSAIKGILETNSEMEACRSQMWDRYRQEFSRWRELRKVQFAEKHADTKFKLLDQLTYFRSQRLYDQEKKLLQRLFKMFPTDETVSKFYREHKERYADEILQKHIKPKVKKLNIDETDPELDKMSASFGEELIRKSESDTDMAYELAVSALMHEQYEAGLKIIEKAPPGKARYWLKLELLLGAKHHLELLHSLPEIELCYAEDSETFFATAYYRAQAIWGLGQNHLAIEVLESLLESRPSYRSGLSLLSRWKTS